MYIFIYIQIYWPRVRKKYSSTLWLPFLKFCQTYSPIYLNSIFGHIIYKNTVKLHHRVCDREKVKTCVIEVLWCEETNLDSILKGKDIILPTEVHIVKAMVFPILMYGCESWIIKNAKCRRVDAFELWCWRRLLRVPWTSRRSNLSILKAISPEYSLEGLMMKLKLQYFGHLMQRTDSLKKTLMLGKRRREEKGMTEDKMVGWHHWLRGHEFKQVPGVVDGQGSLACCSPWGRKQLDTTEWLNWMWGER